MNEAQKGMIKKDGDQKKFTEKRSGAHNSFSITYPSLSTRDIP